MSHFVSHCYRDLQSFTELNQLFMGVTGSFRGFALCHRHETKLRQKNIFGTSVDSKSENNEDKSCNIFQHRNKNFNDKKIIKCTSAFVGFFPLAGNHPRQEAATHTLNKKKVVQAPISVPQIGKTR